VGRWLVLLPGRQLRQVAPRINLERGRRPTRVSIGSSGARLPSTASCVSATATSVRCGRVPEFIPRRPGSTDRCSWSCWRSAALPRHRSLAISGPTSVISRGPWWGWKTGAWSNDGDCRPIHASDCCCSPPRDALSRVSSMVLSARRPERLNRAGFAGGW